MENEMELDWNGILVKKPRSDIIWAGHEEIEEEETAGRSGKGRGKGKGKGWERVLVFG